MFFLLICCYGIVEQFWLKGAFPGGESRANLYEVVKERPYCQFWNLSKNGDSKTHLGNLFLWLPDEDWVEVGIAFVLSGINWWLYFSKTTGLWVTNKKAYNRDWVACWVRKRVVKEFDKMLKWSVCKLFPKIASLKCRIILDFVDFFLFLNPLHRVSVGMRAPAQERWVRVMHPHVTELEPAAHTATAWKGSWVGGTQGAKTPAVVYAKPTEGWSNLNS